VPAGNQKAPEPTVPAVPAQTAAAAPAETPDDVPSEPAAIDALLSITSVEMPVVRSSTALAVAEDLEATTHDIDIPLNPKVLSSVELLSGRLKGYLEDGLGRGAKYLPMIQEVFRDEGVPLDLAYVPLIESAFKPTALSRAKAKGIWQFMQGTGIENGLKHDWYIDERSDPEKATRAAARYLKTLYGMFGDWHLALASYNGGPGRVQQAMKRSGRKDFWELASSRRYLPQETRDYVPLILAAVLVARNPDQYGMVVEPEVSDAVEFVTLTTAVDLRKVADWLGLPLETIQTMNPELRRWTTPVKAVGYELRVPDGTGDLVRERIGESNPSELSPLTRYTVKKGDTLLSVAKRLGVTRSDLAAANYLKTSALLATGQQLIVPRAPKFLPAGTLVAGGVATEPRSSAAAPAKLMPVAGALTSSKTVHRVKSGETLTSIARLYQTSVASLQEWNDLRTTTIRTGQRLTIYSSRAVATN
jgi:membrane-bound lytic murein transglycosylase D